MNLRDMATQAANIADRLTWEARRRKVDGESYQIVPAEEAQAMKSQLLEISRVLNDIHDRWAEN